MKKLIVIEGKEKYQFEDIKSLVEKFINSKYYSMNDKEKQNELEKRALANTFKSNYRIKRISNNENEFKDDEFIINNEITYILSMAKFNRIMLLERKNANIFGRYIDNSIKNKKSYF